MHVIILPAMNNPATDDQGNTAIVPVVVDTFIGPDGEHFTREHQGPSAMWEADDAAYMARDYIATHVSRVIGSACLLTGEATLYVCR